MQEKIILITGGLGYIGSHGVVVFEQAGYKTVIVDNLSNSSIKTMDGIEKILGYKPDFFEIDLRTSHQPSPTKEREQDQYINYIDGVLVKEKFFLDEIFKKYKFDGVLHFAGLKSVGESCEKALEYFDNNVNGSIVLFELMEKYLVKNIIFSSSATVYDAKNKLPLKENSKLGTTNPYGTTKLLIEKILEDLAKFSGFNVINLRYFNPIGAHNSGELGENPEGIPNNLLPFIMKVATGELEKLSVFGDDYETIDGTGVRDYIDVVDLIDGHLKAYELLEKSPYLNQEESPHPNPLPEGEGTNPHLQEQKGFCENFNLGVGRGVSVLEMIKKTKEVIGKKINYEIVARRDGDLAEAYCDPSKANNILGWKAKVSLEESLKNTWKFYNK